MTVCSSALAVYRKDSAGRSLLSQESAEEWDMLGDIEMGVLIHRRIRTH